PRPAASPRAGAVEWGRGSLPRRTADERGFADRTPANGRPDVLDPRSPGRVRAARDLRTVGARIRRAPGRRAVRGPRRAPRAGQPAVEGRDRMALTRGD